MRSTVNSMTEATDAEGSARTDEGLSDRSSLWPMQRNASTTARSRASDTRARRSPALLVGSLFELVDVRRQRPADEPGDDRGWAGRETAEVEGPGARDAARSAERETALAHETILVAEDEAVVREMVVAALERLHYRVVVASTGEEAVRLIDRLGDEIDLLLSDVVMPGMSGLDLYDRALRTRPDLKAIFMSGYTALAIGRKIPDGITLLKKPFSAGRLNEVVRATLGAP